MTDKILHVIMLGMVLITAVVLILFAHSYLSPDLIFTSMIAGTSGIVGARIASNGYVSTNTPPPAANAVQNIPSSIPGGGNGIISNAAPTDQAA